MRLPSVPFFAMLLAGCLATPSLIGAASHPVRDRIVVLSHIPLTGGPVARLLPAEHYGRDFLYVEQEDGKLLTVLDVTHAPEPLRVANISYPANDRSDDLIAAVGTAALVASPPPMPSGESPETVRIMNFADPEHPAVSREFTGVTAMANDDSRGLIYLANSDGVWILARRPAQDPAALRAYAHDVLYDH